MRLLKIGHDVSCDIVINSPHVSSLHAEITLMNSGDILLEDKNSRNGTFVMNQRIASGKPVNIRRGDIVKFADVELQWSQVPMPEDNSAYRAVYGIGSNFNNDIQISGNTVSRYHATLKEGKDGKMYIIDHSKNGTTVDGMKIPSNTPVRIKRKSAVVCGGVPVDLSRYFKTSPIKPILTVAASVLVLVGIGLGVWKLIDGRGNKTYIFSDEQLYNRFNNSVVMLTGIFHYEVSIGDVDVDKWNKMLFEKGRQYRLNLSSLFIPKKLLWANGPLDVSTYSTRQLIDAFDKKGTYGGTGFFISEDGKLLTNLHVVKPWMFDENVEIVKSMQNYYAEKVAQAVELINAKEGISSLSAYVSKVKVDGVLDYIALVPEGEVFDADNITKCRVLSAGEDTDIDIALIQTISKRLPTPKSTYVNVKDSMDVSDEALTIGRHMYTLGFPMLTGLQDSRSDGIHLLARGGSITQILNEYSFGFDAAAFGGASGSPVFNDKGMLIGILNAGATRSQGFNYGIKAKYVKNLLESPYKK